MVAFLMGIASNVIAELLAEPFEKIFEKLFESGAEGRKQRRIHKKIARHLSKRPFTAEMKTFITNVAIELFPQERKEKAITHLGVTLASQLRTKKPHNEVKAFLNRAQTYKDADEELKNSFWHLIVDEIVETIKVAEYSALSPEQKTLFNQFSEQHDEVLALLKKVLIRVEDFTATSVPPEVRTQVNPYSYFIAACPNCQTNDVHLTRCENGDTILVCARCGKTIIYPHPQSDNFDAVWRAIEKSSDVIKELLANFKFDVKVALEEVNKKLDLHSNILLVILGVLVCVTGGVVGILKEVTKPKNINVDGVAVPLMADGNLSKEAIESINKSLKDNDETIGLEYAGLKYNGQTVFDENGELLPGQKIQKDVTYEVDTKEKQYESRFVLNGIEYETTITKSAWNGREDAFNAIRPVPAYYERTFSYDMKGELLLSDFKTFAQKYEDDCRVCYVKDSPIEYLLTFNVSGDDHAFANVNVENFSSVLQSYKTDNPMLYYEMAFRHDDGREVNSDFEGFINSSRTVYVEYVPTDYPVTFLFGGQAFGGSVNVETFERGKLFSQTEVAKHFQREYYLDSNYMVPLTSFKAFMQAYKNDGYVYVKDEPILYPITYTDSICAATTSAPRSFTVDSPKIKIEQFSSVKKGSRIDSLSVDGELIWSRESGRDEVDLTAFLGRELALTPTWKAYYSQTFASGCDWLTCSDSTWIENVEYYEHAAAAFQTGKNLYRVILGDPDLDDGVEESNFAFNEIAEGKNVRITVTLEVDRINLGFFQIYFYLSSNLVKHGLISHETATSFTPGSAIAIHKKNYYSHVLDKELPIASRVSYTTVLPRSELQCYAIFCGMDARGNGEDDYGYRKFDITFEETDDPEIRHFEEIYSQPITV